MKTLTKSKYESTLKLPHSELLKLQRHFIACNDRIWILVEGRDAAGKDGLIKRIVERLSPRGTGVVGLGKSRDRERRTWYFQRCAPYRAVALELEMVH